MKQRKSFASITTVRPAIFSSTLHLPFVLGLNPYNAQNGVQDRMFDPDRVVCITDDNGVVTEAPVYNA